MYEDVSHINADFVHNFTFDPPIDAKLVLNQYEFGLLPDLPALNELRTQDCWVSWRYFQKPGRVKPTKPPINPHDGKGASHSDPSTWATFAQAAAHTYQRSLPGVGFVITEDDGYTGFDLDDCVDAETGEIEPWAQAVINLAETYTEISPTGTGLRLLARGKADITVKVDAAHVEIYRAQRYLTITGRHVKTTPTEIQPAPRTFALLLERVGQFDARKAEKLAAPAEPVACVDLKAPRVESAPAVPPKKGDFFRNVNDAALLHLSSWVPAIFESARLQPGTRGYRVSSAHLGRDLQEDLSFSPSGIVDFGVADMGDANEGRRTAIDIVLEYSTIVGSKDAALWLCGRMGKAPELLGFGVDDAELASVGAEITHRLDTSLSALPSVWSKPDLSLFSNGRRPAPEFDPAWLGPHLESWLRLQARGVSAPLDYVATSMLALTAAVIGNRRWPKAGAEWSEPPLLWCALVGSPSTAKSPAMGAVTNLLDEAERMMAAEHGQRINEFEAAKIVAASARETWENNVRLCAKEGGASPEMPPDAKEPTPPVCPRVKVGDATTEKLGLMAAANSNAMLLARDELDGWYASFGRYGSSGSDRSFALEMYGGREFSIERVKHPIPIRVRRLSIGVLGGIQPDKVAAILDSADDGLVARMLWCFPEPLSDFRISREKSPADVARSTITRLSQLPMGTDEIGEEVPVCVPLDEDGVDLLEKFALSINARAGKTTGLLQGALGKTRGHVLRLSCVVEHLWWAAAGHASSEPRSISARAVGAACDMMEDYFLPMAERVLGDASIPVAERNAMALASHIRRLKCATFNARELRREIGGVLREAASMEAACGVLEEAAIIRGCHARQGSTKGRKAKTYEVNPEIWGPL